MGVWNVKFIYFGLYYCLNKFDLVSIEELNVLLLKMGIILYKNNVIFVGDFNVLDVEWISLFDFDKLLFVFKKFFEVFDDYDLN